jgi:predicted DNA-binding transcriptional regulator AlpA
MHLFNKVHFMSSKPNQTIKPPTFDDLPDSAFVRESQLVYDPRRPEFPAPLPFSAATLWRNVAAGKFPKPVKLSQRVTCWRVSEVRAWMTTQCEYEAGQVCHG